MNKKKSTMKDVAQQAGVSISSVSHVINKTRKVEEETKDRILLAIRELNYVPNLFARSLKGKGTKLIGVIISDIRDSFYAEIVKSIEFSAFENEYNVILCDSENQWKKDNLHLDTFIRQGVDGIIYSASDMERINTNLVTSNIPFVQIDRKNDVYNADFVGIDNIATGRKAVENLYDAGCRNIGFIGYNSAVYTLRDRSQGWKDALIARGIYNSSLKLEVPYHNRRTVKHLKDYFIQNSKVDGIVCCNNNFCYEAILEIEHLGKQIPKDIKIVTYDDSKWFEFLKYPISVIVQPTEMIGRIAVDTLISRIESGTDYVKKDIILETEYVNRN